MNIDQVGKTINYYSFLSTVDQFEEAKTLLDEKEQAELEQAKEGKKSKHWRFVFISLIYIISCLHQKKKLAKPQTPYRHPLHSRYIYSTVQVYNRHYTQKSNSAR